MPVKTRHNSDSDAVSETQSGRMKEKVREFKKSQIIEEAIALIYEVGFHPATMDRLCEKLQVTKPFLYSYFDNKHALLVEIYDRLMAMTREGVSRILEQRALPEEKVFRIAEYLTRVNIDYQSVCAIYVEEEKNLSPEKRKEVQAVQGKLDDDLTLLIEQGVRDGVFDVEYPRIAALSIYSMARWTHRWYRPGRLSPEQIGQQHGQFALNLLQFKKR